MTLDDIKTLAESLLEGDEMMMPMHFMGLINVSATIS